MLESEVLLCGSVYSVYLWHYTGDTSRVVMQKGICMGYEVGVSSLHANANGNVEK